MATLSPTDSFSPIATAGRERIVLADALRGFALMGLFLVHMLEYFELYWYRPEPGWEHHLVFFLFGAKAYGIFALLFGLSFFIILDNHERRGVDFRARFCWRLLLLLGFGYLHSLLYAGDILQLLAVCGFLLVLSQRLSTGWLVAIAAFFLLQVPQLLAAWAHASQPGDAGSRPLFIAAMTNNFEVFAHGDLPELVRHNLLAGQKGKWLFFLETGRLWNVIGLMYAGAVLGRIGFFERQSHRARKLATLAAVSVCAWLLLRELAPLAVSQAPAGMARWSLQQLFGYYGKLALICAGVLLFVALFQLPVARRLLTLFAPAGRMTLTFYIAQSLVFVPVYYGFGLAAFEWLGQSWSLVLGVACWFLQMWLAHRWLRRHSHGPLEKLWRRLTFIGFGAAGSRLAAQP